MSLFGFQIMHPYRLLLLLLLIPMIIWYVYRNTDHWAKFSFSSVNAFIGAKPLKYYLLHVLFALELLAFALLVIAFSRPRKVITNKLYTSKGIDIVLALDISPSMMAEDLKPNRMEAAKDMAIEFINGRPNDRIGIVAFGGESFTVVPLTLDHAAAINMLRRLHQGMVEDGTAIGLGLANAVARLANSKAKSKVIILLTDGRNNRGSIDPITAAKMAAALGIRVYTIGVGTHGYALVPVTTMNGTIYQKMKVDVDEATLRQIAKITGGKYFRATDTKSLEHIYKLIDKLEKTRFRVHQKIAYEDQYWKFAMLALILLSVVFISRITFLRVFP